VVLIDDSPDVRYLLNTFLTADGGFQVVGEAGDPRRGRSLVRHMRPDLAIVDLALGRHDGIALVRSLRAGRPELVIAVVSGFVDEQVRSAALAAGADVVAAKQQLTDDLIEVLADASRDRRRDAVPTT